MAEEKKPEVKKEETKDTKQKRINECAAEVNRILDQYGCTLSCYFIVTSRGNSPHIKVISK